jgi:hypothetical protein
MLIIFGTIDLLCSIVGFYFLMVYTSVHKMKFKKTNPNVFQQAYKLTYKRDY